MKILFDGKEIDATIDSIDLPVSDENIRGFRNLGCVSVNFSLTKESTKSLNKLFRKILPSKPKITWRDMPVKKKGKK